MKGAKNNNSKNKFRMWPRPWYPSWNYFVDEGRQILISHDKQFNKAYNSRQNSLPIINTCVYTGILHPGFFHFIHKIHSSFVKFLELTLFLSGLIKLTGCCQIFISHLSMFRLKHESSSRKLTVRNPLQYLSHYQFT